MRAVWNRCGVDDGGVMSETACANRLCWGTK